jgi:phage antirepressor YoqD-like protein
MATSTKERKAVKRETVDKKKVDLKKVKKNDLMAFIYWGMIEGADKRKEELMVKCADNDEGFRVKGVPLIETSHSADQYHTTKRTTKTRVAETLVSAHNRPLSVCFVKTDGTERVLRGRLVKPEPLLGRSMVEDLDLPNTDHRLRQVDHRTIKWLIVDGVKYTVRS